MGKPSQCECTALSLNHYTVMSLSLSVLDVKWQNNSPSASAGDQSRRNHDQGWLIVKHYINSRDYSYQLTFSIANSFLLEYQDREVISPWVWLLLILNISRQQSREGTGSLLPWTSSGPHSPAHLSLMYTCCSAHSQSLVSAVCEHHQGRELAFSELRVSNSIWQILYIHAHIYTYVYVCI